MVIKKFKTDIRLWLWISLVLFLAPWFIPIIPDKNRLLMPISSLVDASPNYIIWEGIGILTLLFGVPAVAIGWVFQCMIVLAKGRREHKAPDTSPPPPTQTGQIH